MSRIPSVEFLESKGFRRNQYPDGFFWVRYFTREYVMQVTDDLSKFSMFDGYQARGLTSDEFMDILTSNDNAINQKG